MKTLLRTYENYKNSDKIVFNIDSIVNNLSTDLFDQLSNFIYEKCIKSKFINKKRISKIDNNVEFIIDFFEEKMFCRWENPNSKQCIKLIEYTYNLITNNLDVYLYENNHHKNTDEITLIELIDKILHDFNENVKLLQYKENINV